MKKRLPFIIAIVVLLLPPTLWVAHQFRQSRRLAQLGGCIGNLRMYDSAKEQWAMANDRKDGDEIVIAGVMEYVKGAKWEDEACPATRRNTYTLGKIGEEPACSIHGTMSSYHLPGGSKP